MAYRIYGLYYLLDIGTLSEFSSWYQDGKNKRFAVVFNFY